MSKVKIEGNASGTGTFTITSPNSSTDRTITLPDVTGTLVSADASGNVGIGTSSPSANLHISDTGEASILINADSNNDAGEESGFLEIRTDGGAVRHRVEGAGSGNTLNIIAGATGTTTAGISSNIVFQTKAAGASAAEAMRIKSTGDLAFNSGYGSVATAYGIRAWVNFNGTGTVAIRSSGNVSSITDQSTGQYVVNLATAMPDTNYSTTIGANYNVGGTTNWVRSFTTSSFVVASYRVDTLSYADTDTMTVNVAR